MSSKKYPHYIQYHFVWCVKYNKNVLTDNIKSELLHILYEISKEEQFTIINANSAKNHVHMLVECKPTHLISELMHKIKGKTSRMLMKKYPKLRQILKSNSLWTSGYYCATETDTRRLTLKEYINNQ